MATIKKKSVGKNEENLEHWNAAGGNVQRLRGKEHRMVFLKKLKIGLPYDPAIPLLSTYPKELKQGLEEVFVHIHL